MTNFLSEICGLKIVKIDLAPDDFGILFENNISLAIYNKIELKGIGLNESDKLIGKKVICVNPDGNYLIIFLDKDISINVDMSSDAYSGPEAHVLWVPDKPIQVWRYGD
ncbi:MAG: hypothetical protein ABSB19_08195 [Methylomonas sp.]|jgi:hypothetical protein